MKKKTLKKKSGGGGEVRRGGLMKTPFFQCNSKESKTFCTQGKINSHITGPKEKEFLLMKRHVFVSLSHYNIYTFFQKKLKGYK